MDNRNVEVSVVCLAYNHEKYIKQAIDSIVSQKTSFSFEVLINDDCSTDNTAKIIKEYEKIYSGVVKGFYQLENQYSKGISNLTHTLFPNSTGKYIALCECDDIWTDENKLQKQYNLMESNPDISLCIHNAYKIDISGKIIGKIQTVKNSRICSCEEVIEGGGGFCATNSIFTRRNHINHLPEYIINNDLDYYLQTYLSTKGITYCFDDFMSAYRVSVEGSWSYNMTRNPKKYWEFLHQLDKNMEIFNELTNYQFDESIKKAKYEREFEQLLLEKDYKRLYEVPYRNCHSWKKLKFTTKTKILLWHLFFNMFRKAKNINEQ